MSTIAVNHLSGVTTVSSILTAIEGYLDTVIYLLCVVTALLLQLLHTGRRVSSDQKLEPKHACCISQIHYKILPRSNFAP